MDWLNVTLTNCFLLDFLSLDFFYDDTVNTKHESNESMVYMYSGSDIFRLLFLYNITGKAEQRFVVVCFFPQELPDYVVPTLREVHLSFFSAFFRINNEK